MTTALPRVAVTLLEKAAVDNGFDQELPPASSGDAERLDVFNGLLLAPHLDAAFDRGFITVADDGTVVVSAALDHDARGMLGLHEALRVRALHEGHRAYLPWHRERVFKQA